jgi:MFS family permease
MKEASLGAVRERREDRGGRLFGLEYKWSALSCTSLGALLATINNGTLIIALPELARSLNTDVFSLVWVLLSYMLAQTALVLMVGRFADMVGRKKLYVGGFALFTVMSLVGGFATNAWELILVRTVMGRRGRS